MALAQAQERWFHVRVDSNNAKGEIVRVNLPMSVAEAVLPAVHTRQLHEGKIKIHGHHTEDVDLRAILDAVVDGCAAFVERCKQMNVRPVAGPRTLSD